MLSWTLHGDNICYAPLGTYTRIRTRSNPSVTFIPTNILVPAFVWTQAREGRDKELLLVIYSRNHFFCWLTSWGSSNLLMSWRTRCYHMYTRPGTSGISFALSSKMPALFGKEIPHAAISLHQQPSYAPLAFFQVPLPGSGLRGWLTLPCVHLELLTTKGHPGQPTWLCRNHSFSLPESIPRKWRKI